MYADAYEMTIDVDEVLDLSIVKIVIVYYELKKIKITGVGIGN